MAVIAGEDEFAKGIWQVKNLQVRGDQADVATADLADLHLPHIALGLDGGVLAPSPPSTIVDAETGEVLREGSITRAQISVVLDSLNP